MVRQLWLLRHADAEPHGARPDAQRRLTSRGERQALTVGRALSRIGVSFHAILSSPKVRAQQTAQLAVSELTADQHGLLQTHPPLAGDFRSRQALEAVSELGPGAHLLLVGHEPDLSGVLCELTGARAEVKKGGLAMVRFEGLTHGELALLMRPHELALLAGENGA